MRQIFIGLIATVAVATISATPAMACGGYASGCAPCGPLVVSPCGRGYHRHVYPRPVHDFGAYHTREHLVDTGVRRFPRAPRYFHANQGPTFTGPGMMAPVPVYRERPPVRWGGYYHGHPYRYTGGPYANPLHHHYYGAPRWHGPAMYTYRWRHHHHARPGFRHRHRHHHHAHHMHHHHMHRHGHHHWR